MTYDELVIKSEQKGICVNEYKFNSKNLKGLYVNNIITVNSNINNEREKRCVLAEEIGHHYTSAGNILDQSKTESRKQEKKARAWAFQKLVPLKKLISAYKQGVRSRYELAEYLNVTEQFLEDAVKYYKGKYGICYKIEHYLIYFEPLGIVENYEIK